MPRFSTSLFVGDSTDSEVPSAFQDHEAMWFNFSQTQFSIHETLIYKVRRQPKNLMAHLRRIFFCYQNALSEPLYAALLDLLIVLKGKGRDLSRRLIQGSRSRLDSEQLAALNNAHRLREPEKSVRFSLFTTELVGSPELLEVNQTEQEQQQDYLALANDFIEFSQLEEAMSILESGVEKHPDKQDLQTTLLQLYKATHNRDRFQNQYETLHRLGVSLVDEWQLLVEFFNRQVS